MRNLKITLAAAVALLAFSGQWALASKIDQPGAGGNDTPPPPPPPPPSSSEVLLSDDFSSEQWGTGTDSDTSTEYVDGALKIIVFTKNYFTWSTPNRESYSDVHQEVTVLNNGTDKNTAMGLLCDRQGNTGSFYYLAFTPSGEYAISRSEEGKTDVFLTNNDKWGTSDQITKNAKSYRVGADCGNGTLTLYVDGVEIASAKDKAYKDGGVGVVVWSAEKPTKTDVSFDDYEMSSLQ